MSLEEMIKKELLKFENATIDKLAVTLHIVQLSIIMYRLDVKERVKNTAVAGAILTKDVYKILNDV